MATPARPVSPPANIQATIEDPFDGDVTIAWKTPTQGPPVTGYRVNRTAQGQSPNTLVNDHPETPYVDPSAEAGVQYSYTVQARSADNVSPESNSATIEAPAPPSGLTATPGEGAIELAWTAPARGTSQKYRLERQEQDSQWTHLTDVTGTAHSDTTVQPDVTYRYRAQNRNAHGGSAWTQSPDAVLVSLPGSPTGLTATSQGDDNVLSWTAPDSPFIDGYQLEHRQNGGEWTLMATVTQGASHTHQDAPADHLHEYRVRAENTAGEGPWSDIAETQTITPPLTPGSVTVSLEGADLLLTWQRPDSVHVTGYTVRHAQGDGTYVESAGIPETQTSHRVANIPGDIVHRLGVRAHNDGGDSDWSTDVQITRVLAPLAPTDLQATVSGANITLSWTTPATGTVDGYHVEYGPDDSTDRTTGNAGPTETTFAHADNEEGVTYSYRVRAHNTAGNGPWSEAVTARRLNAPGAPTGVVASASRGAIIVTWTPPQEGTVEAYEVRQEVRDSGQNQTSTVAGTETRFIHQNTLADTPYSYEVRARNDAGASDWAGPVHATRVVPPPAPTGAQAQVQGETIRFSWTAPTTGIIGGYQVELRQQNREQDWTRHDAGPSVTGYTHSGPTPGTTYEYRVRTTNSGGYSPWTPPVTQVWTQGAAPPTFFEVQPYGDNNLLLQWGRSATPGVTSYRLRSRVDGGDWTQQTPAGRYGIFPWSPDQKLHEYSVRAMMDEDPGDWSPPHRVSIAQPGKVRNLRVNREGSNGARLHWEAPETGQPYRYRIEVESGSGWYLSSTVAGYKTTFRHHHQPWGSTFRFRVVGMTQLWTNGAASDTREVSLPVQPQTFDELPSNLDAHVTDGEAVHLTWNAPESRANHVTGYRVYRKKVSDNRDIGATFDHVLVVQTGNAGTSYTDHTAQPGVLYEYAVSAYRASLTPQYTGISPGRAHARTWQ